MANVLLDVASALVVPCALLLLRLAMIRDRRAMRQRLNHAWCEAWCAELDSWIVETFGTHALDEYHAHTVTLSQLLRRGFEERK